MPHLLEPLVMICEHWDISEQSEVVAALQSIQVRTQVADQRFISVRRLCQRGCILLVRKQPYAVLIQNGLLCRQRSRAFVFCRQVAGGDFTCLDVRLIERIDADDRSSNRSCYFPPEELLTQVIRFTHSYAADGLPSPFERGHLLVLSRVGRRLQPQVGKDTVLTVDFDGTQLFAIHGNNAMSLLAGRFCDELLEPGTQAGNSQRGNDGDLVTTVGGKGSENDAEDDPRFVIHGNASLPAVTHLFATIKKFLRIQAHER